MRPNRVTVVEVGPRDGLQNEAAPVATADKVEFVNRLSATGVPAIEVSAFVSPKWVPQMADGAEVFAQIERRPSVRYSALVPNLAGLERAMQSGVAEVAIFAAASETFSQRNINQTIDDSLASYRLVCDRAREARPSSARYLSTAFGCPFEGNVDPFRAADVAAALIEMGAFEVAVSDTIGIAHPGQVPRVIRTVAGRVPLEKIALHFHDTRGTALANVLTALDLGIADLRCVVRRSRRLSLRAWCDRESGDRRSDLHARRPCHRDWRRPRGTPRRVDVHRIAPRPFAAVQVLPGCEAVALRRAAG